MSGLVNHLTTGRAQRGTGHLTTGDTEGFLPPRVSPVSPVVPFSPVVLRTPHSIPPVFFKEPLFLDKEYLCGEFSLAIGCLKLTVGMGLIRE